MAFIPSGPAIGCSDLFLTNRWEGRFKSCVVDAENYLLTCMRYIELNPVRAGMAARPEEYQWSSYHANGLGKKVELWTPHEICMRSDKTNQVRTNAYRELYRYHLDNPEITQIRNAVNQCMALGNERLKQEIERLSGRRVTPLKRGPRPKDGEFFM